MYRQQFDILVVKVYDITSCFTVPHDHF